MELNTISIDQDEAIEQLGRYRKGVKDHPDDPIYRSVERGLRWLARTEVEGLLDIRRAISEGGEHDDLTPRLAIMRADMRWCWLGRRDVNGSVQFWHKDERGTRAIHGYYDFPAGTLSSHVSGNWTQDQNWRGQHGFDHSWSGSVGLRAVGIKDAKVDGAFAAVPTDVLEGLAADLGDLVAAQEGAQS